MSARGFPLDSASAPAAAPGSQELSAPPAPDSAAARHTAPASAHLAVADKAQAPAGGIAAAADDTAAAPAGTAAAGDTAAEPAGDTAEPPDDIAVRTGDRTAPTGAHHHRCFHCAETAPPPPQHTPFPPLSRWSGIRELE